MKSFKVISFVILLLTLFIVSCDVFDGFNQTSDGGAINGAPGGSPDVITGNQTIEYEANTPSRDITSDSYDALPDFSDTVSVSLNVTNAVCSGVNCDVSVSGHLVTVKYNGSGNVLFNINGSLNGYGLAINYENKGKAVGLDLSNVSITSTDTPCILLSVKGSQPAYIELSGNNTLTDGRAYGTGYGSDYSASGDNSKGTLYSKGALIFRGTGTLTITESYKHAIASKDYIKVNSGTFTINTNGRNGFHAVNGFIMNNGNITINGTGKHTNNESRGIVVEGSEDNPGEGFIVINNGTISIETVSKAITAKWDIDDDAETAVTTDDPYPYVKINNGTINIKTTGTPKEGTYGDVTDADGEISREEIKLAPEGIEGKQAVFINGGILLINSTDDCINSSRDKSAEIIITDGRIYARSSNNDAIDSNGNLTIKGGIVVAIALTAPECAFDCDNYTFAITGGIIAGIGTSNYSEPTSTACKQGVLVLASSYLGVPGKTIAVKNENNGVLYAYTIPSELSIGNDCAGIFSCPGFTSSGKYSLISGATASGNTSFYGHYTDMPTVSGGTSYSNISFEKNYVYTAGSTGNHGPQEGHR